MNVGTTPLYWELVRRPQPQRTEGVFQQRYFQGVRQTYVKRFWGDWHMPARPRQRPAILPAESAHLVHEPSTAIDPWAASGPVVGPSGGPIGSSQGLVKPARDERSQARSSHTVDPLLELLLPEPCRELELRQGC